jgi:hypothetical protein
MKSPRPVLCVALAAFAIICDGATPEFEAYQNDSMRIWKAIVENKYENIGKSVDWIMRLEYSNGVAQLVSGYLKPGRYGECEVSVVAPTIAYIGGMDAMKDVRNPLDFYLKAGDWIHVTGIVYKADSNSVTIAATSVTNLGRRPDLE